MHAYSGALALLNQLAQRYAWQTLTVDGHDWCWLDTSAPGAATVLIPGSIGNGAMFVRTLLSLGERRRLVAITYPALDDATRLADGLARVCQHIGLSCSVIVGSSFGAYWAQFFALRYPSAVRALVLGNGFVDGTDLADNPLFDRRWVESVAPAVLHRQWVDRTRAAPASELQQLQLAMLETFQSPDNLHARFLGVVRAQACPPLPLPDTAITVLECDDDPLIAAPVRARLRQQYPGARHVCLSGGGHYPHLLATQAYEALLSCL